MWPHSTFTEDLELALLKAGKKLIWFPGLASVFLSVQWCRHLLLRVVVTREIIEFI